MNQLTLINEPDILKNNKIVLYGAGLTGRETQAKLKLLGIEIMCFCDRDADKLTDTINGKPIISITKLKELDEQCEVVIIITTIKNAVAAQIIDTLTDLCLRTPNIFLTLTLDISLMQNIYQLKIDDSARQAFIDRYLKGIELLRYRKAESRVNDIFNEALLYIMERHFNGFSDILVYQAAKVGSSTIKKSLRNCGIIPAQLHFIQKLVCDSEDLKKLLTLYRNSIRDGEKQRIITPIRDPISRNISAFMHNLYRHGLKTVMDTGESFMDNILSFITSKYDLLWDWFDDELKQVFHIDVYDYPFDKDQGYSIIQKDNIEVLIFQLEKINSLENIIGEFAGVSNFRLSNEKVADDEIYKYIYRDLKNSFRLPNDILSLYYGSDSRIHFFYSDSDIQNFTKRWKNA